MGRLRRTMTMRGPYQIKRYVLDPDLNYEYKYNFALINTETGEVIDNVHADTPIPPLSLRKVQSKLNTKAILDNPRGWLEL